MKEEREKRTLMMPFGRTRRGYTRMWPFPVLVLVILLGSPLVAGLEWQFNQGSNSYTQQGYPLAQSADWLSAAGTNVPYNPSGVWNDTAVAWAYVNQSQSAVHAAFGADTACWLWATPMQTYSYYDTMFIQLHMALGAYEQSGGLFKNTTLTSWSQVLNTLGVINMGMGEQGLDRCVGSIGNEPSTVELFVVIGVEVMLATWMAVIIVRE